MVGAFIPEGTVAKMRGWTPEQREEFKRALVANALNGIVRINSRGRMTIMVFLLEIFETDLLEHKKKTLQLMPEPARLLLNECDEPVQS